MRRTTIHRRTLLRGLGASLALPWFEAMIPRAIAGESHRAPQRLACLFMPNGVHSDSWTPSGSGTAWELSSALESLSPYKDDLLVFTNLWHQNSRFGDGHYVKTSGFLTGTTIHKTVGFELNCNGVSLDQLVAKTHGHKTPIASMQLGVEPMHSGIDKAVGYTRLYGGHISWSGPRSPLAKEINPRLAFQRLMRATSKTSIADRHLLDLVLEDARQLRRQLGDADRRKMDEYLQSVRELERSVNRLNDEGQSDWHPLAKIDPASEPQKGIAEKYQHQDRVEAMLDIVAMAFQTDSTRVCSFMFGNSVSGADFSFLDGVKGGHHDISHHSNDKSKLEQYARITRWHVEQYGRLLGKLKAMPEGESNVLDNSLVLFGSGLRDGNGHKPHNLPIVLAGKAGGRINPGQHIVSEKDSPLANLYLTMLTAMDVPLKEFADSTTAMQSLIAS